MNGANVVVVVTRDVVVVVAGAFLLLVVVVLASIVDVVVEVDAGSGGATYRLPTVVDVVAGRLTVGLGCLPGEAGGAAGVVEDEVLRSVVVVGSDAATSA